MIGISGNRAQNLKLALLRRALETRSARLKAGIAIAVSCAARAAYTSSTKLSAGSKLVRAEPTE
jgi:hypothetical protein